jgi:signal transduction histidine kinase/ActR/RegA family two-component response regulator
VTDEPFSGELDAARLDAALTDLTRSVESLRRLLRQRDESRRRVAGPVRDVAERTLSVVEEILSISSTGLEPHELFTLATDRIARLVGADRVMLFVADGHRLRPRSARGFRRTDLDSIELDAGEGLVGRAFSERRVLSGTGGGDEDAFIERFPVKEAVAVPVRADDDVVGVLYAGRRAEGQVFTPNDVLLLLVVADRMGGALVHQGLLDRHSASVRHLTELAAFAGEAPLGRRLPDVLNRVCEVGCRITGVRAAAVGVGLEDLELVAARGLPRGIEAPRSVSRRDGLTAELYARDGPVVCRDVQGRRGAERSFLGEGGFHGCLLVPMKLRGLVLGVLYLADAEVRDFSAEEIEGAGVLAAMAASAIENSRVHAVMAADLEGRRSTPTDDAHAETARVLSEMAVGVARELNQVFAVVLGKSQLLLARASDEAVREGLGVIEEAAWRGADVVHRVGALAAPPEAGAVTDLRALAQDAVALARTRWREESDGARRIEIAAQLDSVPPVRGDEAALRDIVAHLVRNAFDAMPNGGQLIVAVRQRDSGVELAVEDSGEGLADDVKRRMFDPFFTTRAPGRMGLGLTMARTAATRYGGRVEVAGAPGRGSTARLWLPQAAPAAGVPATPAPPAVAGEPAADAVARDEPAASPAVPLSKPRASVLVLEDEEPVRALLVDALAGDGYEVDFATDGLAALAKIEGRTFDVVLADLALPQRSGLAIARAVKLASPRTPVILITGWAHLLDPQRLREHGVDLMLVKPFRADRVVAVVRDALRLHRSA